MNDKPENQCRICLFNKVLAIYFIDKNVFQYKNIEYIFTTM